MERWKPPEVPCVSCLKSQEVNHIPVHPCSLITCPSMTMTSPNGDIAVKNGKAHNHLNGKNGVNTTGHVDTTTDRYCCLVPSNVSKSVNLDIPHQDSGDTCGLGSLKPEWLQPFANKKAFLAVFCLTSVLQGMYYTYFVSVLTTIEKLYQIQSKTTGIIMSATEIGQIGGALLLTYYGGQGHRPKWIACGMLVFAVAAILCATPHFLFNEETSPPVYISELEGNATAIKLHELSTKLCQLRYPLLPHVNGSVLPTSAHNWIPVSNLSSSSRIPNSYASSLVAIPTPIIPGKRFHQLQEEVLLMTMDNNMTRIVQLPTIPDPYIDRRAKCELRNKSGMHTRTTHTVLSIFFVSLLFIGIGATAVYTLGIPYIDDNVATRESPLYFGITIGVRIFGPVFGFLLGSYCTSVDVNFPFEPTTMTADDPQWIGAWWLGVFIVGACLIVTALPMMAFPKKLPQPFQHQLAITNGVVRTKPLCVQPQQSYYGLKSEPKKPSLKNFPAAMKRLLRNQILLLRTASSVLHILPIAGLYTFLPKYLESQFQLTATNANMISGMAGILVMGFGIFGSGTFMRKFKPTAKFVARWIAAAALAYSIGMIILMWLGCPLNNYVGLNAGSDAYLLEQKTCNSTCNCRVGEFAPICTSEGVTYLSPCLAGCLTVTKYADDQYGYKDCLCLGPDVTAKTGFCPLECNNLTWYIIIFSVFVLAHSTSEVGSMLLTLRCVDPEDKAMALGLISFAIGLFGNVPCPIIYGAVVDSACLFWEDNCGEPGACRLYDSSKFRKVFHGVTAVLMFAAFVVDAVVCYKASSIPFKDDEGYHDGEEATPFKGPPNSTQFESSV